MNENLETLFLYEDKRFFLPINYILKLITPILGLNYKILQLDEIKNYNLFRFSLIISYGEKRPKLNIGKHIHIYKSNFFGKNYLKKESLPKLPLKKYNNLPIIYYGERKIKNYIEQYKNLIETNIDIIASIFFMVTRYEEYLQPEIKDRYGRFPVQASIAYKEKFLHRPIVNEYIEFLFFLIQKLIPKIQITKPEFVNFVTHDVDHIFLFKKLPLRSLIGDLVKRKNIKLFFTRFKDFLKSKTDYEKDPYWITFDYFLSKEKKLKKAFYFMTKDTSYNIFDPILLNLIEKIKENEAEIGLHGSFNSFNDKIKLKEEKEILDKILKKKKYGVRQHYLRFDPKTTWQIQNELGFEYDTSCGWSGEVGFRCGTCFPFTTFDLEKNRPLNLKEIPLIIMDGSLEEVSKGNIDKAIELVRYFKNICKKYGGYFTTLWHNSFFYGKEEWKKVYETVIS